MTPEVMFWGAIVAAALSFGGIAAYVTMAMDVAAGRRGRTVYARWCQARYRVKFEEQLVEALGTMANALRAGFSLAQAFESVVALDQRPISDEFALLQQQMRVGMSMDDALSSMEERIASDDLTLVVTSIDIARRTGGNLTEIFDKISQTIRGRMRIERRVRTLTAQGRMQGLVVSLMPVALGAIMTAIKPGLMLPFFFSIKGGVALLVSICLVVVGWLLIRKIVKIEV